MARRLHACIGQRAIENSAKFAERQSAIHFFAIDEKRWRRVDTQGIAFVNGCLHRVIILRLDAGMKFHYVYVVLLPGKQGSAIYGIELRVLAFVGIDHVLVGMEIVGQLPIRVGILRGEMNACGLRGAKLGEMLAQIQRHRPLGAAE